MRGVTDAGDNSWVQERNGRARRTVGGTPTGGSRSCGVVEGQPDEVSRLGHAKPDRTRPVVPAALARRAVRTFARDALPRAGCSTARDDR
jgi:hypothetical protein